MHRVLDFCGLFVCLYLLVGVSANHISTFPVSYFQQLFTDPSRTGGTMLSIDVNTNCISNVFIKVHVPAVTSGEANARLLGPPFDLVIQGSSDYSSNTRARVQWNGVNITFSQFIFGQASGVGRKNGTNNEIWWNINFDMPKSKFPLSLELNPDVEAQSTPFINLGGKQHFTAWTTNDTCLDGTIQGDPVFAGFQGQTFQFHGLPDEHFNLVSSPDVQLNSHFVYLSSGKCDYSDTACFSHAGTYMDALGLSVADARVKVIAGTHAAGLRVWVNDEELRRGAHMRHISNNVTTSDLKYHTNGRLEIHTDIMRLEIVNSDMFFNIRVGLNDKELLRVGSIKHTVTDNALCKSNIETNDYQLVEQAVAKKYDVTTPLHGLIGQTWRNVKVCGRDWMGTVEDYVVSDLFASDSHFNYFNWAV